MLVTIDVSSRLSFLLAGLNAQLQARIRDRAGEDYLPPEQWRVLGLLVEKNARGMNELAALSFVEPPTLTKIVDRMVADGLVYRSPDMSDRRRVLIVLAERGRARFESFDLFVREQEAAVLPQSLYALWDGGAAPAPDRAKQDRSSRLDNGPASRRVRNAAASASVV